MNTQERAQSNDKHSSGRTWVVLGSANGSTNLGDESMWEAAATALREIEGPVTIITDGPSRWRAPL